MVVVVFRSRLLANAGSDYAAMAQELLDRARTTPGFVDFKSFVADDGEHVAVIHWESAEQLRAWSDDLRHVVAQRMGRDRWYQAFHVEVAEVMRAYGFDREATPG